MATTEEANEFLGGLAAGVDETLSRVAPGYTFALIFWPKDKPVDPDGIAIMTPPTITKPQAAAAMRVAAECIDPRSVS